MSTTLETKTRGVLILVGAATVVFGLVNVAGRPFGEIVSAAVWFTVPAVLSDAVLLPAVAGVGWLLTKKLPPWSRLPIQVALALVGVLTAIAAPFIAKFGVRADNPTLLNRDYLTGWAMYVAVIVLAGAAWAGWRWMRLRNRQQTS